ncbi:tripartite tricarboxylate transporter substrate binding protein [Aquabacterium sp. J223]|uniref:tripartite tricarboxylate transporter substrate binding protein n=1 Tax=Aquabacterium sp. J223 TaxID=2898431 RepID=UPI0021AD539A|nr:tripartite tricarboxylate transporter substrate binding protein [Aquabacterium sp. J223]UUX97445.1 tripartite tricarboxylate transporter substrate binding protein [Aquabacterium sp. J223]
MTRHPSTTRRLLLALAAAACAPAATAQSEPASAFPSKPVKLIVPFAPGGPTDTAARLIAERLQANWKQPVVIDYKPGGGTTVGTSTLAKSPADGYTLGMAISAFMINASLQPSLPYDTLKDLTAVSQIAQAHYGVFAHPSAPFNTVAELVAYTKKNPDAVSYATPGIGTGTHLAGELLNSTAGIRMVHVPYKGSAPAQQDVLGGRVPLLFDVAYSAMPFVRDKRLKVIALASPKRSGSLPEVPTIAETLPGVAGMSVIGVIAPAGVPRDLLRRIGADIAAAVKSPEVVERMAQLGMEPVGSTPDEYNALIRSEIDKWQQVVKAAGIKPE